jgi:hypothetical protein
MTVQAIVLLQRFGTTILDATPSEHLTFLVTATGKPYGGNHFSESFREWCDAAELPKRCERARAAQGGMSSARGRRMQRRRDREHQRTREPRRNSPRQKVVAANASVTQSVSE